MRRLLACRRTYIATLAIGTLFSLGMWKGMDVASAIAAVSMALGAANAAESVSVKIKNSAGLPPQIGGGL